MSRRVEEKYLIELLMYVSLLLLSKFKVMFFSRACGWMEINNLKKYKKKLFMVDN